MKEITLISCDSVKELTSISDNLSPKFLRPAIISAQEDYFLPVVGQGLYDKLKSVAEKGDRLPQLKPYFDLLDRARYFLAYSAVVKVLPLVNYKVDNAGVLTTGDDKMTPVDRVTLDNKSQYYKNEADSALYRLQKWILERKDNYPELKECDCIRIKSNIYSSASCGIWLGGARGRKYRR